MNTSDITTRAEIQQRLLEGATIQDIADAAGVTVTYNNVYDILNGRPVSIGLENQVRVNVLDLDPIVPRPVKRVAIDPTTEGVRKLPGHGDTPYTLRTWRGDHDTAARLDRILAAMGVDTVQGLVDQVLAKNGAEAA